MRIAVALALTMVLVGACGGQDTGATGSTGDTGSASQPVEGAAPWPRPEQTAELAEAAGVPLDVFEHLDYHVHAHLDVFVDGEPVEVPAAIGIVIDDPAIQEFPSEFGTDYGGISEEGCQDPCISALHTHAADGVLHTESEIDSPNTLGQFFIQWDVALDAECVGGYCEPETPVDVFVDGELYEGDPADIELVDARQISIVIGTPPAEIPSEFGSSGA